MWSWVPDVNFLYYSTNYAVVREIQVGAACMPQHTCFMDDSCI
jgi:hypothetical protein|eukprot:COSAG01_NODE_88_length_27337_cov_22.941699_7_plen_43_part_00